MTSRCRERQYRGKPPRLTNRLPRPREKAPEVSINQPVVPMAARVTWGQPATQVLSFLNTGRRYRLDRQVVWVACSDSAPQKRARKSAEPWFDDRHSLQ